MLNVRGKVPLVSGPAETIEKCRLIASNDRLHCIDTDKTVIKQKKFIYEKARGKKNIICRLQENRSKKVSKTVVFIFSRGFL